MHAFFFKLAHKTCFIKLGVQYLLKEEAIMCLVYGWNQWIQDFWMGGGMQTLFKSFKNFCLCKK